MTEVDEIDQVQSEAEAFLTSRGWQKTHVRIVHCRARLGTSREQSTWWKKQGHDCPQHLALWLERVRPKCIDWLHEAEPYQRSATAARTAS